MPATIFLPTWFVGTDEWFWPEKLAYLIEKRWEAQAGRNRDRRVLEAEIETEIGRWKLMRRAEIDRALEKLTRESGVSPPRERRVVSWDEVAEMAQHGISFGSHSLTHAILTLESADHVDQELRGSLRELQARRVNCVPVFCYPNGDYSARIADQVRAAGYRGAVCSEPGREGRVPRNVFALRRVAIHNDVSLTMPLFAWQLSGLEEALRRPWPILRRGTAEAET